MNKNVVVAGVGMSRFHKPSEGKSYVALAQDAIEAAFGHAGLGDYSLIGQIYAGYVYGESCSGQAAVYETGLSGVPITNVNNNCSTGSTALFLARQAVASGSADCALAVGFEQMPPGALGTAWTDRVNPLVRFKAAMSEIQGEADAPPAAQLFGGAGREHMELYGTRRETFAKIALKARRHAKNNPNAVFRDDLSLEQILSSPPIFDPLTRLQCCPPTCGAAAALVCSAEFARRHGLDGSVQIIGQTMTTDTRSSFDSGSMMNVVGYDMAVRASHSLYDEAGVGPQDVDVVELHDCFTTNELLSYEAIGLVPQGQSERFVEDGDNTYGGQVVVNPSGGLLSKGHPLGATGLAQCAELVWQLRDQAEARQVSGARTALQHNLGVGGACVMTMYQRVH
ncbi:lipid-transfer protein [Erythrobacter sp. AP23]|uniref:lipid-transfer protein n=1 Tax=Erythrobacter sp. AP23 TaxID=499656 RepID=UPI00076D93F7|nr:lipid-transfer protein [Erythrobacter sp. AP23]KWV93778.1 lipid-transfer protein [Erythrobacter sp. AP23]